MNGARALVHTLVDEGVDVCFANPGTSEMHFVAALDDEPRLRCVLGLFEGTITGAADGYGRLAEKPAATLLHLGPGLANGLSNLHNASRAHSPIVNIIGDHASHHRHYDAPLTSDIEGTARPFSHWVRTSPDAKTVGADAAAAIAAARSKPGKIASLILPADTAWSSADGASPAPRAEPSPSQPIAANVVDSAARILLSGEKTALILGTHAAREPHLQIAGAIAERTGAALLTPTYIARISRGAGRAAVTRIPYPIDQAIALLAQFQNLVLIGVKPPVAFFAYPDRPSQTFAPGTRLLELSRADQDQSEALRALHAAVGAPARAERTVEFAEPRFPSGRVTPGKIGALLAALIPEDAIVIDESITTGRAFLADTQSARPHEWLLPTGGSIGFALPAGIGAAIAAPGRRVIVLESDGSGMYMPQSLWTYAREGLDIVTLVFANRKYQILRNEMKNVGAAAIGPRAKRLLDIDDPAIDWVRLASSLGVNGHRVDTAEALKSRLEAALSSPGPSLIEIDLSTVRHGPRQRINSVL